MNIFKDYPILKAGTLVTCPRCSKVIAKALIDIVGVGIASSADFEAYDTSVAPGKTATCECGESYGRQGKVHTENGWFPGPLREPS